MGSKRTPFLHAPLLYILCISPANLCSGIVWGKKCIKMCIGRVQNCMYGILRMKTTSLKQIDAMDSDAEVFSSSKMLLSNFSFHLEN